MITWGISAGGHDASLAVLKYGEIVWASHSERYSRIKNDDKLDFELVLAAKQFGVPTQIVWHEHSWSKRRRELRYGQWRDALSAGPAAQLSRVGISNTPIVEVSHHHSHAAAAYYTSGMKNAAILVIDAIGEWETLTVWQGLGDTLTKVKSVEYPNSLGLFYSAMTHRCGFKPNEEEYIVMGLAALGDPDRYVKEIEADLIEVTDHFPFFKCRFNHHKGFAGWRLDITDLADLAAAAQSVYTKILLKLSKWANTNVNSSNLIISGGCALNCVANAAIARQWRWNKIWIMPNPGDAGNSIGAALAHHGKMIQWHGPYLGHKIEGNYPIVPVVNKLLAGELVGIANGRAEFGPRALGNRSLFGDPRLIDIRDRMNVAKKRENFRPFAPVIMAEHAKTYFENIVQDLSYMQYAVKCKYPAQFPGIVHVDGTSRVQTVTAKQHLGLYNLLKTWYNKTGCPMLVNTSLNIKGQPMVNTEFDAKQFENEYGIKVFCR